MFLPKRKMRCKVTRYDARHSQCFFFYFRFRFRRSFKETLRSWWKRGDFIWIPICKTTILIAKTPKNKQKEWNAAGCHGVSELQAWMFGTFRHAPYSMVWGSEATTFMAEKPSPESTQGSTTSSLTCNMFHSAGDDCCSAPLWPSDWIYPPALWQVLQTVWSWYVNTLSLYE